MKHIVAIVSAVFLVTPALASAQVYYYSPSYASYPQQYSNPYGGASYQTQNQGPYQPQSQSQGYGCGYNCYSYQQPYQQPYQQNYYQPSYYQPTYSQQPYYQQTQYQPQSYYTPTNYYGQGNSYGGNTYPSYGSGGYGNYAQLYQGYPTNRTDAFGSQLCNYGDYPVATPCQNGDPQQWIVDPYTGQVY